MHAYRRFAYVSLSTLAIALAGCTGYVKKADFDSAISELRANDQKQQQEIDSLTQQMQQRFAAYDAKIAQMNGRIRVDAISAASDSCARCHRNGVNSHRQDACLSATRKYGDMKLTAR